MTVVLMQHPSAHRLGASCWEADRAIRHLQPARPHHVLLDDGEAQLRCRLQACNSARSVALPIGECVHVGLLEVALDINLKDELIGNTSKRILDSHARGQPHLVAAAHLPAVSGWLKHAQSMPPALPAVLLAAWQQLTHRATPLFVLLLRPLIEHATQAGAELLACEIAMQMAGADARNR